MKDVGWAIRLLLATTDKKTRTYKAVVEIVQALEERSALISRMVAANVRRHEEEHRPADREGGER